MLLPAEAMCNKAGPMAFTLLDWSAIIGYLAITLILGLYFRRSSTRSSEDYFVSGRKASWWLAGTSMVATTFAADTPLLVAGLVYTQGIAGKLDLVGFFAFRDDDCVSVRPLVAPLGTNDGRAVRGDAIFRQARRASFAGSAPSIWDCLMNCLILGWVTKAMINIVGRPSVPRCKVGVFSKFFSGALKPSFGAGILRDGRPRL